MAVFQYGNMMFNDDDLDPTEGADVDLVTTGSGGTSSATAAANARTNRLEYILARDKAAAATAAAAAKAAREAAGAQAQYDYYKGQLGAGVPKEISGNIDAQETAQTSFINTQAKNLLAQLAGRRDTATGITTQGYDSLSRYLAANQPRAFQEAQQASPVMTQNALAQYMQAQGASPAAVTPETNRLNALATGGADNYNQLLNVLRAAEQSGAGSRASEGELARALAGSQLQAIYGNATSGVEAGQLSALNQLAQVIANARLKAQQDATARDQAIQDALAKILGTGVVKTVTTPVTPVTPPVQGTPAGATAALEAIAAGTAPQADLETLLQLIAVAQQDPNRAGGDGGGGGGISSGNAMVAF